MSHVPSIKLGILKILRYLEVVKRAFYHTGAVRFQNPRSYTKDPDI